MLQLWKHLRRLKCCQKSQRKAIQRYETTPDENTALSNVDVKNDDHSVTKGNLGLGDFPLEIIQKIITFLRGWDRVMFCSTCLRFRQLLLSSGPIWDQRDLAIPVSADIGQYSILFRQIVDLTIVLTTEHFTSRISICVPMKERRSARNLPFFARLFPDLTNASIKIVHVYLVVKFSQHRLLRFLWSFDFESQVVIYPLYGNKNRRARRRLARKSQRKSF